ncbi:hypothetical protein [Pseudooceanicola sp.]|uniref:hypothetical protein n=1 Tax=Pseudooceanicola sp. TaxID=1914328 RepID=UPI004057FC36
MKIDFSQTLNDLEGEPMYYMRDEEDASNHRMLTLGRFCGSVLNAPTKDHHSTAVERGEMALRVFAAGVIEIKPEEAALIRRIIKDAQPAVAVYQATQMLDPGGE